MVTLTAPQEREEKVWFPAPRSGSSQPLLSPVTHQCLLASADTYTDTVHISPCRYIKNTSNRNICLLHFYLNTTRLGLWGMHCFRHFLRKTNKNTHHIPRIKRSSYLNERNSPFTDASWASENVVEEEEVISRTANSL